MRPAVELVVLASMLDFAPVPERYADGWAEVMLDGFKAKHADIWQSALETMNPRHIGRLIADVVMGPHAMGIQKENLHG